MAYRESNVDPKSSGVAVVSLFDYSPQNHFSAMNAIRKLCGIKEEEEEAVDDTEIERLRANVTFIRQWKDYQYVSRTVKFSCDTKGQPGKDFICEENLPQFSAANVPKTKRLSSAAGAPGVSTDYVLYVGGHVWALDWCPNVRQRSDCHTKCEYLAVSAHAPESSYHKIGVPLIGRGVIQIWCLAHVVKEEELQVVPSHTAKRGPRKNVSKKIGRPRKKDTDESLDDTDDGIDSSDWENEMVQGNAARNCDVKEKKPLPMKRKSGRLQKQKDMNESTVDLEKHDRDDGSDNSKGENKTIQGTAARICDGEENNTLSLKKARGRPRKQKDKVESLFCFDTKNKSCSSLSVDIVGLNATSSKEHAPLKICGGDDGLYGTSRGNQLVQETDVRLCDAKEKKSLPPKKGRGRPRKQKDMMKSLVDSDVENKSNLTFSAEVTKKSPGHALPIICCSNDESTVDLEKHDRDDGLANSKGENKMIQGTAARICDGEENNTLPLKKARGRPRKQKDKVESLFGFDTKNKSSSSLSVDIIGLNEATGSKEHARLKVCSGDDGLYGSSRGNQMVQETDAQLCDAKEKKTLTPKKGRGRPREQKDTMKSLVDLDAENKSNLIFSAEVSKKSPDHALPIICHSNEELDDLRREHLMVETIQLCDVKEKKIPPRRGRPRKQKDTQERLNDLHSEKEDTSKVSSGFLTSTETIRGTSEHAPLKNCGTNDMLDNSNKTQMVQATSVQSCDVKEYTPFLLKKGKKNSKQAISKFLLALDTESETDSALPAEEDTRQKSHDMDDRLDSDRGNQIIQATAVQVVDAKEKEPLLSIKTRGGIRKQRETKESLVSPETEMNSVPALAVDISEVPSAVLASTEAHVPCCDTNVERKTERVYKRCYKKPVKMTGNSKTKSHRHGSTPLLLAQDEDLDPSVADLKGNGGCGQVGMTLFSEVANSEPLEISTCRLELPKDVALPRVVLCLAHNGKVAWDVKWKPPTESDEDHKHRMGYLAVLLGNGSLEVWEIPSPRAIEILYSSLKEDSRDPRFVKLEPVFRCSKLKSGDRHSIPLTVEWSRSSPHNLLLAGCHDGTVALWKFAPSGIPQDTRPLLCFTADIHPIRALAWAPDESDEESSNIVAVAGHGGIRFWDIRDPYRPLCEFIPVRRFIYSMVWLPDPRCVIMTYDDGSMRILSLSKFSSDVAVTGKPSDGTQQPGSQNYSCSSYAIWSIHGSRRTGQVMYCGADGSVRCFQLTRKMIDMDPRRNRVPHFLCGSLTQENSTLTVNTPWPNIPIKVTKPMVNPWGDAPSSIQDVMFLNQTRANDQTPERDSIALGHNDDPFGSEHISASKSKTTSKKRKIEPAPIQVAKSPKPENRENVLNKYEVLPPKMVALHRVRWNMNRGSERWVCYGGAAGIVRCQEMYLSSTMVLPSD